MRDYIDREVAIMKLVNLTNNSDMPEDWHVGLSAGISALYRVPSADRPSNPHDVTYINALKNRIKELEADRPQGEWIIHSNGKMCDCSACNESYDRTFEYVDEWNFCPNCGAKMK